MQMNWNECPLQTENEVKDTLSYFDRTTFKVGPIKFHSEKMNSFDVNLLRTQVKLKNNYDTKNGRLIKTEELRPPIPLKSKAFYEHAPKPKFFF